MRVMMQNVESGSGSLRWVRRAGVSAALIVGFAFVIGTDAVAQESPVHGSAVTMSSSQATLELELASGETRTISFQDGNILVDGTVSGSYEVGGSLEKSWRDLLRNPDALDADAVDDLLLGWSPPSDARPEAASALSAALSLLQPATTEPALAGEEAVVGDLGTGRVSIAPGIRSLDGLTKSMEQLRRILSRIGSQALVSGEDVALVVHDDYVIDSGQIVNGDLVQLEGDVLLEGTIRGDVIVLDGELSLAEGSRVEGDLLQVGGEVLQNGGAVLGELVSVSFDMDDLLDIEALGDIDVDVAVAPDIRVRADRHRPGFFGRIGNNIGHAVGGLALALGWLIGLGVIGALLVYFFRPRLEVVADTARLNLSRSFGVGLAGQLLFVPIGLVLVVGIVTWLVLPFYVLAAVFAIPAGYIAAAHAAGEVFDLRRYDWVERLNVRRSNSYWYVWTGLALLLAPFAVGSAMYLFGGLLGFLRGLVFFAAGVITWTAITTGLGAILLSRAGSRREYSDASNADLFAEADAFGSETPGV
ncbi:MAG: hypothetical protein ACWGON_02595 [Gemmatimonadota bacterium]